MAVSEHRIAVNTQDWLGGDEASAYTSVLPDKYNGECKPALDAGVTLQSYTNNGTAYTAIHGNSVIYNAIDSVQNFDDGSGGFRSTELRTRDASQS